METKDVVIGNRQIKLKEISYLDFLKLVKLKDNLEDYTRQLFEFSGIAKEIYESFSVSEGNKVIDEINSLNNFTNFQADSSQH